MSGGNSPFLFAIGRHDGGALVESADELLRTLVQDVVRYGGKGKLTLELTVEPNGGGLKVGSSVKATSPKRPSGEAFYWSQPDGSLSRDAPAEEMTRSFRSVGGVVDVD